MAFGWLVGAHLQWHSVVRVIPESCTRLYYPLLFTKPAVPPFFLLWTGGRSSSILLMLRVKRLLLLLLNSVTGVLPPCSLFPILWALWLLIEFSSVVSWSFSPHKWFIQIKWSYWGKVKLGFNLPQVSFEPSSWLLIGSNVESLLSLKEFFFKIVFARKWKNTYCCLGILTAGARSRRCLSSEEVSCAMSISSIFFQVWWLKGNMGRAWVKTVAKSWFLHFLQYPYFSPVAKGMTMSLPFCR